MAYLIAAVCINCLIISLGLSTFWIHVLYGTPLDKLIPSGLCRTRS